MYWLDDSRRPLSILHFRGALNDSELSRYHEDLAAIIERGESFAVIFDVVDVELPSPAVIRSELQWFRGLQTRYRAKFEERADGPVALSAYHLSSPVIRNILAFFNQMLPSVRQKQIIAATLAEAVEGCEEELRLHGVELPPPSSPKRERSA